MGNTFKNLTAEHQQFIRNNKKLINYIQFDNELKVMKEEHPKTEFKKEENILDGQLIELMKFFNKIDTKYYVKAN